MTVPVGVIGGVLIALWFSTVVAMGPPSGSVEKAEQNQQTARKDPQTKTAQKSGTAQSNEKQESTEEEAECGHHNATTYPDCVIQLRTARAAEKQAYFAELTAYVAAAALIAAAVAAAAGLWTVIVMRRTAVRQLRAYLFPSLVRLANFAPNTRPQTRLVIKNTGQTPAYEAEIIATLIVANITIERSFPRVSMNPCLSRTFLGAGGMLEARSQPGAVLSEADHAAIMAGTKALYLVGRVNFIDAFKKDRFVNFRYVFMDETARAGDGAMAVCAAGNDAN